MFELQSRWTHDGERRIYLDDTTVEWSDVDALPADPQSWIDRTMSRGIAPVARIQALSESHTETHDGWPYMLVTTSVRGAGLRPEIRVGAFYVILQSAAFALARTHRASAVNDVKTLFASARLELPRDVDVALAAFWSPSGRAP